MMRWAAIALLAGLVGTAVAALIWIKWANPRVVEELLAEPKGERARTVMLLTLPSGKTLPVNYLRDGNTVYAAADFPWWRELRDGGGPGRVWIQGEEHRGHVRSVRDDPALRDEVFERLRPTAPRFAGTLVVIDLE